MDEPASGQEKLNENAELWRFGLFLTFLLCLFLVMVSACYNDMAAQRAFLKCGCAALVAWVYIPGIIEKYSRKEAKKDGNF